MSKTQTCVRMEINAHGEKVHTPKNLKNIEKPSDYDIIKLSQN
jgi:hypothetical protein